MKEIQKNLDNLFLKAGQYNRYQFIIEALFAVQFLCSQFFHVNFTYLTAHPIINFNGVDLKPDINWCKENYNEDNPANQINLADDQLPTTSIIIDFELTCQKLKIYLIYIIYYSANILGSCLSHHFYETIGSKISLIITAGIQITSLFLLEIIGAISNKLIFLYIDVFLIGFNEYVVANLLFLYICDIINFGQIPLFITIITCGRSFASLLGILFFRYIKLNWKHDMCIMAGIDVLVLAIILFYMVSSPKAALRNNKYMIFIHNLLNLAKKNQKQLEKEDFDFLIRFMTTKEKDEYHRFFASYSQDKISNDNIENYPADGDKSDEDEDVDELIKNDSTVYGIIVDNIEQNKENIDNTINNIAGYFAANKALAITREYEESRNLREKWIKNSPIKQKQMEIKREMATEMTSVGIQLVMKGGLWVVEKALIHIDNMEKKKSIWELCLRFANYISDGNISSVASLETMMCHIYDQMFSTKTKRKKNISFSVSENFNRIWIPSNRSEAERTAWILYMIYCSSHYMTYRYKYAIQLCIRFHRKYVHLELHVSLHIA